MLETPAPKVYAWNCEANDNPVGAEYIIMEKMSGIPLEKVWQKMELTDKLKIILQIHKFQQSWLSCPFGQIGSLYFRENIPTTSLGCIRTDAQGSMNRSERYAIGRILGRDWTDDNRGSLDCHRGPCNESSSQHSPGLTDVLY